MREECTMWRSAFIVLLLAGSPALAGQVSTAIHVGITITGNPAHTHTKARALSRGTQAGAADALGTRSTAPKRSLPPRSRPAQ
jgi:hypothetical protein